MQKGKNMENKSFNAFEMAQAQFDHVADILDLDQGTRGGDTYLLVTYP